MKKEKFDKTKAGNLYNTFSRTLLYNQVSANVISVKNFPNSMLNATEHAVLDLKMKDFYNKNNNSAFLSYCHGFRLTKDDNIAYGSELMKEDVKKELIIERENCGKLMEVLFCLKFGGVPLSAEENNKEEEIAGFIPITRLIAMFQVVLDKEADEAKWDYLNKEINKFIDMCNNTDFDMDVALKYINEKMCLEK